MSGKAVLISIRPEWCEKILNGEKTIEVRKTRPKQETPFKCYIYMTRLFWAFDLLRKLEMDDLADRLRNGTGKVVGEFVCDEVLEDRRGEHAIEFEVYSCVPFEKQKKYSAKGVLYGWHISNLKIYDEPKYLYDFMRKPCEFAASCGACHHAQWGEGHTFEGCELYVNRAPQSWCYVEELT